MWWSNSPDPPLLGTDDPARERFTYRTALHLADPIGGAQSDRCRGQVLRPGAVPRCRAETRVCPARAAQPEALPAGRPAFSSRPPGQSARRAGATALPCVQRPGPGCDDAAGATKSRGGGMRKLRIVGVEADSSVVECEVPASGEKFTLPLDDRFRAAARGEYLA